MTNKDNAIFTLMQAAVDWVTLTAPDGNEAHRLYKGGCALLDVQKQLGNAATKQQPHGFDGTHCGKVFVGRKGDSTMLRVSGCYAHEASLMFQDCEINVTRIDLQTTWKIEGGGENWAENEQRIARRKRLSLGAHNLSHIRHILGNGRGDTTMIGSRSSPRYGRLYDKARESGEAKYNDCWRYEIEYKGSVAKSVWQTLCSHNFSTDCVRGIVFAQYDSWMFDVDFMDAVAIPIDGAGKPRTDAQKKIDWIQSQVLPSMEFIMQAGYGTQLKLVLDGVDGLSVLLDS